MFLVLPKGVFASLEHASENGSNIENKQNESHSVWNKKERWYYCRQVFLGKQDVYIESK